MLKGQRESFNILRENRKKGHKYVWFHAASLGEFEQGRPLIESLRKEHPEYKILLTFFSPSGYEIRKNYEGADIVCYLPFDLPWSVGKFLDLAQPSLAIFIKYEFWMNYLSQLQKRKIPTYIVSAIFRPEQIFFKPYAKSYKKVLSFFDWIFVQDEASQELLFAHDIHRVSISGDTRFDRVCNIAQENKGIPHLEVFADACKKNNQSLCVAGSTWAKDEDIIIDYFNNRPDLKLIIAPHEIGDEHLQQIILKIKRPYSLFSQLIKNRESDDDILNTDCIIIDSIGLLASIYMYADFAYIGGGFGSGIHNILEAAVYGIPVVFGPRHQKFNEAKGLILKGGAVCIEEGGLLKPLLDSWLSDKSLIENAGIASKKYVQDNVGASRIILDKIFIYTN
ncbi:3-deoxy-D-manno-octulosonic-acid transferase [Bacteroidales bacterium]|nr:3-deoxy-D-manno-octulosonic-acid transferase [Bacteroidales bacterium]